MSRSGAVGRILYVPGKNPKPPMEQHRYWLWRALLHGAELYRPAARVALEAAADRFALAAWNRLYYGREYSLEAEAEWVERFLHTDGASETERRAAHSWRIRSARLLYELADRFPFLISLLPDRAVKGTIDETQRYFHNRQGIGRAVRECVKAPLRSAFARDEPVLLIAHSMGSVIAYDALWELWFEEKRHERVDLFLTIGSPLGMRFVQRRLLGSRHGHTRLLPGNIRRWVNVAAQGDITALDPVVCDDFAPLLAHHLSESIVDYHADVYTHFRNATGLNFHRSFGYLAHPVVGGCVAQWWQSHGLAKTTVAELRS